MNVEFTIQEIELMLEETHRTRKENLRLQSLTTDEFLLNVLSAHYRDLLNDLAELQTMLVNLNDEYEDTLVDINSLNHPKHPDDDSCKSYAQLTYEMAQDEYDHQSDEGPDFVLSVW